MSTETEGLPEDSFTVDMDNGEKKTVTVLDNGGFHIQHDRPVDQTVVITPEDVQQALDAVKPDVPYESPPEPTEIKVFGGTLSIAAGADPEDVKEAIKEAHAAFSTLGPAQPPEPVDPSQEWFSPTEFAKRVEETRRYVANLRTMDEAKSAEVIRRVSKIIRDVGQHPSQLHQAGIARGDEDMLRLRQKLNEINFTEEEALLAGNLLSGHATWKIWYENGEWKVVETKPQNPQTFMTSFRHAAAAMKMNNLLNMGKSSVDMEVLAVIGACKRLDDIIDSLPEGQRIEYNALMGFINEMPNK